MGILVQNEQSLPVDLPVLRRVVQQVMDEEEQSEAELSLLITDAKGIQTLNSRYRSKEEPTDVLAFPQDTDDTRYVSGQPRLLGDVVISPEVIKLDVIKSEISYETAVLTAVIHGLLHLCGYGHETVAREKSMKEKEEIYLRRGIAWQRQNDR